MSHTPSHRNDGATEVGVTEPTTTEPTTTESRLRGHPGDARHPDAEVVEERHTDTRAAYQHEAHEKFGGLNWGACFFGWLVAIAMAILLTSIVGAIVAAVGSSTSVTQ